MLTQDAEQVLTVLAMQENADGQGHGSSGRESLLSITQLDRGSLDDAITILEHDGYAKLDRMLGGGFFIELNWRGREYAHSNGVAIASPIEDAAHLRSLLAETDGGQGRGRASLRIDALTKATGWSKGRIKDAATVLEAHGQAEVRRALGPNAFDVGLTAQGRAAAR